MPSQALLSLNGIALKDIHISKGNLGAADTQGYTGLRKTKKRGKDKKGEEGDEKIEDQSLRRGLVRIGLWRARQDEETR